MSEIATLPRDRTTRTGAFGTLDRALRNQLIARLHPLQHGRLVLQDACGTAQVGTPADQGPQCCVHLQVTNPGFYRAIAAGGSVGAAEAYIHGHWRCDDLVALVRLLVRNRDILDGMEGGLARLGGWVLRGWHALQRNTPQGSRRNIAAHYDLGNEFFALFLSPDLMYSSAIWAEPDDTLAAASLRKLERICRKLELRPDDRLIEIGTGWGGLALHAARHYGCHVTTTTISREQHALASERIAAAGLGERVTVSHTDYRNLRGRYDKLVSVEMVEAIGASYLDTYFRQLGRLVKPDGLALVQAITIEDHRYARALRSVDFIKRHVFPGSFIPSINAMLAAKTRSSDFALIDLEDFGPSYARTLHAWRKRFLARLPEVRQQGFDERFIRLWDFYLAYCEGGFLERSTSVVHLLMAKPGYRRTASLPETERGARTA